MSITERYATSPRGVLAAGAIRIICSSFVDLVSCYRISYVIRTCEVILFSPVGRGTGTAPAAGAVIVFA